MDSAVTTIALPMALGIIMFGLGLSLTFDDFKRVGRHPKAAAIALGCQLVGGRAGWTSRCASRPR